ncbi:MAG: ThiF family adenylyltransferase, partial [Chloroflexi bacterium]|nr:ThiF family adenylyltransferase [Chloroflexota bacterium]
FLAELHGFDLIIDATADGGTTRFLNRFSLQSGIPLIAASVTEGGWGGEVVRSIPGVTGCYECYLWSVKDGSVPKPSQNPKQTQVFTRGCGFPTFVGTGFDALALAADAARLAVQTLLRDEPDAYPNAPNDVLVRHNRSAGNTDHPQYESARLPIHHRCAWHQSIES